MLVLSLLQYMPSARSPSSQYSCKGYLRTIKHFDFPSLRQDTAAEAISCNCRCFLTVLHMCAKEFKSAEQSSTRLCSGVTILLVANLQITISNRYLIMRKYKEPQKGTTTLWCCTFILYTYETKHIYY